MDAENVDDNSKIKELKKQISQLSYDNNQLELKQMKEIEEM